MIDHKYIGGPTGGEYFAGLPAADLDSATLDARQRELLAAGVELGIYEEVVNEQRGAENETPANEGEG